MELIANGLVGHLPWYGYVLVALAFTHITIAGVTIYLHRHQAHRALELHAIPSHFFRFWLWLTTGMITKEWAAIHRKHHAKCETAEDPHSPQVLGIKKVFFEGAELYRAARKQRDTMNKYGSGTPEDWIEHKLYTPHSGLGIYLMLAVNLILFGPIGLTIWAVQMAWIPVTAAGIINGIGHYWGYRNFTCEDASTNVFPWGILIGGEELHNNHHAYGSSAKLSNKWFEFDIGWFYIRTMEIVGLAKVKKIAPTAKFNTAKQVCDHDLLNAVITHRYDVLTRYARTVKATYGVELDKIASSLPNGKIEKLKSWLHLDAADLGDAEKTKLAEVLKQSHALNTIYTMRQELSQLWARSNASKEQLLKQLQDWCHRAESSGISSLQTFSHKLRSYA
ncbi:MAG: acyl-CoA desaturase [Sulfuriferula sp.]|nr:acyl-CoA desaturase [Sulfuriferula sp.]